MAGKLGHTKYLFTLAKNVRDEVTKSNQNATIQDITKKSMKHFDDHIKKYTDEYTKMKAAGVKK